MKNWSQGLRMALAWAANIFLTVIAQYTQKQLLWSTGVCVRCVDGDVGENVHIKRPLEMVMSHIT